MRKLAGGALIFAAALQFCVKQYREKVSLFRLLRDVSAALEDMQSAIRWQRLPLPEVLETQGNTRPYVGKYFSATVESMKGGIPLQNAWENEFSNIEPRELGAILEQIELTGDQTHLLRQLAAAQEHLEAFSREQHQAQRERERLRLAASFSAAGLLAILLF